MIKKSMNDVMKGKTNSRFFREGVVYTSEEESQVGLQRPNMDGLRASYSKTAGFHTPDTEKVKAFNDVFLAQARKERERRKQDIRAARRMKILSFRFSHLIPKRVQTLVLNMPRLTPKNIYSYLRAEYSNIEQGPVSLPVYEERKKICGECPHRMFPDGYHDPLGFCTKCGCGANPRAQLTVKLKLPATSCPIGKWDESPGIYEGMWGRIRYIITRRRSK
tara:strand:+ start:63 stop:722 length:660 start_codon:yes stop_codon:yes gene_type:complete